MITATVSPGAYWSTVVVVAAGCVALCLAARRRPGPWTVRVARVIGLLLVVDALSYSIGLAVQGTWSPKTSLPLSLCDIVELPCFWGLAGTLQAVLTPDLNAGFPHPVFFQYLTGHLGIVMAALMLVV